MKRSPLKRKTPLRSKTPLKSKTRLRPCSKKRKSQLDIYNARVAEIKRDLNEKQTPCPVMMKVFSQFHPIDDCHHMAGREGKLLLDEKHWLFVSRPGHDLIHNNPALARENKWLYEV